MMLLFGLGLSNSPVASRCCRSYKNLEDTATQHLTEAGEQHYGCSQQQLAALGPAPLSAPLSDPLSDQHIWGLYFAARELYPYFLRGTMGLDKVFLREMYWGKRGGDVRQENYRLSAT